MPWLGFVLDNLCSAIWLAPFSLSRLLGGSSAPVVVSRYPGLLLHPARFTTGYVLLVGQEPAPSKCVLLSTSRVVRKDMKDWVLSQEGEHLSVKFDVRDLGEHLDTTFRGWSSTLAARVRLVISRLVLIFVLPLDFHGRVRVVRSMYLPAALHGIEASLLASDSLRKLRSSVTGVAEVGRVYRLLEMVGEGAPGHGPIHLLSASAADGFFAHQSENCFLVGSSSLACW